MDAEQKDKIRIDFSLKDTEQGWGKRSDQLSLKFAPQWFEWLQWWITLGALQFLAEKHSSFLTRGLVLVSFISIFFYFRAYFERFEFVLTHRWKPIWQLIFALMFSSLVTAGIAVATYTLSGIFQELVK